MIGHTLHPWGRRFQVSDSQQGGLLLTLHGDSLSCTLPQDSSVHLCICLVFCLNTFCPYQRSISSVIATECKAPAAALTGICVLRTSFSVATLKTHDYLNPSHFLFQNQTELLLPHLWGSGMGYGVWRRVSTLMPKRKVIAAKDR